MSRWIDLIQAAFNLDSSDELANDLLTMKRKGCMGTIVDTIKKKLKGYGCRSNPELVVER